MYVYFLYKSRVTLLMTLINAFEYDEDATDYISLNF